MTRALPFPSGKLAVVRGSRERYDSGCRIVMYPTNAGAPLARSTRTTVGGTHRVPGDKSITHRALLLAALAPGNSTLHGALTSEDARSTARVLRQLGAAITPLRSGSPVSVQGHRRFAAPAGPLDCGNSGTTARLLLGLLAAHRFAAVLTGDRS